MGIAGLGVGWIDQRIPFQRSVEVVAWLPSPLEYAPTALHTVADTHDTPDSSDSSRPPARAGVGSVDQRDPFQRSASIT